MDQFNQMKAIPFNPMDIMNSSIHQSIRENEVIMKQISRDAEEKRRKDEEYKQQMLDATLQIRDNTASLQDIIVLLRQSNANQDEIVLTLTYITELVQARDKVEATSIFKKAVAKINEAAQSVESIAVLTNTLMMFYNALLPVLDKLPT